MPDVVCASIDEKTGDEAATMFDSIGLTVSDPFRPMMVRIATGERLPFELLLPNEEIVAAMLAARRGKLAVVGGIDGLVADPNAEDQADGWLRAVQTGIGAETSWPVGERLPSAVPVKPRSSLRPATRERRFPPVRVAGSSRRPPIGRAFQNGARPEAPALQASRHPCCNGPPPV